MSAPVLADLCARLDLGDVRRLAASRAHQAAATQHLVKSRVWAATVRGPTKPPTNAPQGYSHAEGPTAAGQLTCSSDGTATIRAPSASVTHVNRPRPPNMRTAAAVRSGPAAPPRPCAASNAPNWPAFRCIVSSMRDGAVAFSAPSPSAAGPDIQRTPRADGSHGRSVSPPPAGRGSGRWGAPRAPHAGWWHQYGRRDKCSAVRRKGGQRTDGRHQHAADGRPGHGHDRRCGLAEAYCRGQHLAWHHPGRQRRPRRRTMSDRVDAVLGIWGKMTTVIAEWFDRRPRHGPPHRPSVAMAAGSHGGASPGPSRPTGAHRASSPGGRDVGQHRGPATTLRQYPPRDTPLKRSDESRARRAEDDARDWAGRYNNPRGDVEWMGREPLAARSRSAAGPMPFWRLVAALSGAFSQQSRSR